MPLHGLFDFTSFLQFIWLYYLNAQWKDVPLWFCALCILRLQFHIIDDIGINLISINSIIIIIIIIMIFCMILFNTTLLITKKVTTITTIQTLWLNNKFQNRSRATKKQCSSKNPILSFKKGFIKQYWFIFRRCGQTFHTW